MKNILKLAVAAIVLTLFIPVSAYAADNVYIQDDAGILTDSEENQLRGQLAGYDTDRNYLVVTEDSYTYSGDMHGEMDGLYSARYGSSDGVAFIINMSDRQLYTGGFGTLAKDFRSGDARDVTDNVYRYASRGEYAECISRAFTQINEVVSDGFILRPMRYAVAILFGLFAGFFIMFIAVVNSRKNRKVQPHIPADIGHTEYGSAMFSGYVNPAFTAAVMHRSRRSSGSGSSSGGGGGFSGGGGSSGGGHGF